MIEIKSIKDAHVIFKSTKDTIKEAVLEAIKAKANLSNANLNSANLSNANLSHADLSFADLRFADLNSANLTYAKGTFIFNFGVKLKLVSK